MNALESITATVLNNVQSMIQATGYFTETKLHEPKSQPGNDLFCAVYVARLDPVPAASGLASTTFRLELTARIYQPFSVQSEDLIDMRMTMATAAIVGALSGDFDIGGAARDVDLLGAHGTPLSSRTGYQNVGGSGGGVNYRISDITIPIIINDGVDQLV